MRTLLLISLLFSIVSCNKKNDSTETQPTLPTKTPQSRASSGTEQPSAKIPTQISSPMVSTIEDFRKTFERAVIEKKRKLLMSIIDASYKKEQHQGMLKGNTRQFLDELFCGNLTDRKGYKCIKLDGITGITLASSKKDKSGNYTVEYEVSSKAVNIICSWVIKRTIFDNKDVFSLVGTSG